LSALQFSARELGDSNVSNGALELVFLPDSKVYDGRFANNSWLQELADPLSKQSWGNAARMSPKTAAELRVGEGDLVQLTLAGRSLELPAIFTPGQAEGTVAVSLGYGRHAAGHVGGLDEAGVEPVGANAYALRTIEAFHIAPSLSVARVGGHQDIATTQDLYAIDPVGKIGSEGRLSELVREATLEEFKKEPHFAREAPREPLLSLWSDPVSYQGHRWGMSIDLNRCIGCNACVVACVSENNIPVVGKANVIKGREMFWLRVDRYFKGPPEEPQVSFQPIPCQQCENAPCEQVCPVGATMHSHEGLNDMVYNRCIGTRYCSSNCPYKVRRFNYFNYHLDKVGVTPFNVVTDRKKLIQHMAFNPEVTVRARGVMEKCTFCVQRIEKTKIKAKNARRSIQDGEIKTACQQTCPTDAIVFGDLSDSASQVARLQALPRAYALLEELNNRPRVRYLARVRNPHPELA
jgi:molybdopterin-containing oxidoreductase family iron-sulfur binding subunit